MKKDLAILWSFLTFPFLTPKQVTKLHYSTNSHKYIEKHLLRLVTEGYLTRQKIPMTLYPYFYSLAEKAVKELEEKPLFFKQPLPAFSHIPHLLMTNEVMIAALHLPRVLPDASIFDIRHDFTLKSQLKVAIPDARVVVRIKDEVTPLCFEVHLKTGEWKTKEKVRKILQSMRSEYRDVFKTDAATWVFLTLNQDTFDKTLKWIEEELTSIGKENEYDLFRVALVAEENIDPLELFKHPIHCIPFKRFHVGLV